MEPSISLDVFPSQCSPHPACQLLCFPSFAQAAANHSSEWFSGCLYRWADPQSGICNNATNKIPLHRQLWKWSPTLTSRTFKMITKQTNKYPPPHCHHFVLQWNHSGSNARLKNLDYMVSWFWPLQTLRAHAQNLNDTSLNIETLVNMRLAETQLMDNQKYESTGLLRF